MSQQPIGSIDSEQIGAAFLENVLRNERRGYKAYPANHAEPGAPVKSFVPAHDTTCDITNDRSKQAMKATTMAKNVFRLLVGRNSSQALQDLRKMAPYQIAPSTH